LEWFGSFLSRQRPHKLGRLLRQSKRRTGV
jgi:hypothetical protein